MCAPGWTVPAHGGAACLPACCCRAAPRCITARARALTTAVRAHTSKSCVARPCRTVLASHSQRLLPSCCAPTAPLRTCSVPAAAPQPEAGTKAPPCMTRLLAPPTAAAVSSACTALHSLPPTCAPQPFQAGL